MSGSAYPLEKSGPGFVDTSIHHLAPAQVKLGRFGCPRALGESRGSFCINSHVSYATDWKSASKTYVPSMKLY